MVLYYMTKNKEKLIVATQKLFSNNCEKIDVCCAYENGIGRTAKKSLITETDGSRYFVWNNERIYVGNYETFKVDEMVSLFAAEGASTHPVYVYSTLMKFADDIAFLFNPIPYIATKENIPNELFNAGEPSQMLFTITDRNNPKDNWDTTITLTPYNKEHWKYFSDISMSFTQLLECLKKKEISVVNKRKFVAEYTKEMQTFENLSSFRKKRYVKKNGEPKRVML